MWWNYLTLGSITFLSDNYHLSFLETLIFYYRRHKTSNVGLQNWSHQNQRNFSFQTTPLTQIIISIIKRHPLLTTLFLQSCPTVYLHHQLYPVCYISYILFLLSSKNCRFPGYPEHWHWSADISKRIHLLSRLLHSLFAAQLSLNSKILQTSLWRTSNVVHGLCDLSSSSISFGDGNEKNLTLTSRTVELDPSNLASPDFPYSFSLPVPACFSCREESGEGVYSVINA